MGVTFLYWCDRRPGTVVEVKSHREIVVQGDHYKRVDSNGMSESQDYEFNPNPDGGKTTYTKRKYGLWVAKGQSLKGGQRIAVGHRDAFTNPSF
jgi:hypothetical protein